MVAWVVQLQSPVVDITALIPAESLQITQRAYGDMSRLSAIVDDEAGTLSVAAEREIVVTQDGAKSFAGFIRTLERTDPGVSAQKTYAISAQDYNSQLDDDVCDVGAVRSTSESDAARIAWLFSTFGTHGITVGVEVQTIRATMPGTQDFTGMTLHEALTEIAKITGGSFFVDFDKKLHYYTSESNAAPFNLSDDPNYSTTFPYENFRLPEDSTELVNAVYVIGEDVSGWRYAGGTPPAAGARRAAVLRDPSIVDQASLEAAGDSFLSSRQNVRRPGSLVTYRPGARAGQTIQITHTGHGLSAATYRIQSIEVRPITKDRLGYTLNFGSKPIGLDEFFGRTVGQVGVVSQAVEGVVTAIADLSAGGGNLVLNSSFEDGTSWTVGANWTIGFDPTSPQEAFAGSKVARLTLSAAVGGDLWTPLIPVVRTDDYWFSVWTFVRSLSAGKLRINVHEYNASDVLILTNVIDVSAAETDWTRHTLHFANTPAPGVIAWNAATKKVRIIFGSASASATLTADVDGVQLERGKMLTAFAPAPYELIEGSVGTTKITDDAITTQKVAANAIVSGKIAAGQVATTHLAASAVTADKIAAGAVTADKFTTGARAAGSIVANGNFEDGAIGSLPTSWSEALTGSGDVFLDDNQAAGFPISGAKSVVCYAPSGASHSAQAISELFPVTAGERFFFQCKYKATATSSNAVTIWIRWWSVNMTYLGDSTFVSDGAVTAGVLNTAKGYGTAPANAAYGAVHLRNENNTNGTYIGFDDVIVQRMQGGVLNSDGNVTIDASGITVTNGKITVQNPSATVIIDGTSNMFKIAQSGTLQTTSAGGTASAIIPGLSAEPLVIGAIGDTTGVSDQKFLGYHTRASWNANDPGGPAYAAAASGGSPTRLIRTYDEEAWLTGLWSGTQAAASFTVVSTTTHYARYYACKEAAI